jgi:hypothetical protein
VDKGQPNSLWESPLMFAIGGNWHPRRIHFHGKAGVVTVDTGDIEDTLFAKPLKRSARQARSALIRIDLGQWRSERNTYWS